MFDEPGAKRRQQLATTYVLVGEKPLPVRGSPPPAHAGGQRYPRKHFKLDVNTLAVTPKASQAGLQENYSDLQQYHAD
jgi:hypothetical protein